MTGAAELIQRKRDGEELPADERPLKKTAMQKAAIW